MTQHLKKYNFLIITAFIFFISCDTRDEIKDSNLNNVYRLNEKEIKNVSNLLKIKDDEVRAKRNVLKASIEPAPELPYEEYVDLLADKDLSIEIDERMSHILDQSYEENIQYLNSMNIFSTSEIAAVTAFKNELETTHNFNASILHFESSIKLLPLTYKKLQRFYNFIDALKVMNNLDPDFFSGNANVFAKSTSGIFGSCLSATIGVGIAFVGLATIEVGSFGTATAVAVAGFIWASAEWGAACKGGLKKAQYPKKIIKPIQKANLNYITLDENGDVVDGPITLYLKPIEFPEFN